MRKDFTDKLKVLFKENELEIETLRVETTLEQTDTFWLWGRRRPHVIVMPRFAITIRGFNSAKNAGEAAMKFQKMLNEEDW